MTSTHSPVPQCHKVSTLQLRDFLMQLGEIKEENINFVTLKDILGHIWQRQTSDRHNRQEMQDIAENWAEMLLLALGEHKGEGMIMVDG